MATVKPCRTDASGVKLSRAARKTCLKAYREQQKANATSAGQGAANAIAGNTTATSTLQEVNTTVNTLRDVVQSIWQRSPTVPIHTTAESGGGSGGDEGESGMGGMLWLALGAVAIWFFFLRK